MTRRSKAFTGMPEAAQGDRLDEVLASSTPEDWTRAAEVAREAVKLAPSVPLSLRIPARGLALAKQIAAKKGLPYQTYLKMLIHEGIERDRAVL